MQSQPPNKEMGKVNKKNNSNDIKRAGSQINIYENEEFILSSISYLSPPFVMLLYRLISTLTETTFKRIDTTQNYINQIYVLNK